MFPACSLIDIASAALAALRTLLAFLLALGLSALGIRLLRCF